MKKIFIALALILPFAAQAQNLKEQLCEADSQIAALSMDMHHGGVHPITIISRFTRTQGHLPKEAREIIMGVLDYEVPETKMGRDLQTLEYADKVYEECRKEQGI